MKLYWQDVPLKEKGHTLIERTTKKKTKQTKEYVELGPTKHQPNLFSKVLIHFKREHGIYVTIAEKVEAVKLL